MDIAAVRELLACTEDLTLQSKLFKGYVEIYKEAQVTERHRETEETQRQARQEETRRLEIARENKRLDLAIAETNFQSKSLQNLNVFSIRM